MGALARYSPTLHICAPHTSHRHHCPTSTYLATMAEYMETDAAGEQPQGDSKKISFRFCRECSNMLYPKEDPTSNLLMFACRSCQYSEPATAACIYRNALQEQIAETAGNVEDVAQDPTLPHTA